MSKSGTTFTPWGCYQGITVYINRELTVLFNEPSFVFIKAYLWLNILDAQTGAMTPKRNL